MRVLPLILVLVLLATVPVAAQQDTTIRRTLLAHIYRLAAPQMGGRGYVAPPRAVCGHSYNPAQTGNGLAARDISGEFEKYGLVSLGSGVVKYWQPYSFDVNTFPGEMALRLNRKHVYGGPDFLVDAASSSFHGRKLPVRTLDLATVPGLDSLMQVASRLDTAHAWLIQNADSFASRWHAAPSSWLSMLPRGCFLLPQDKKLMWTIAGESMPATVLWLRHDVLPRKLKRVSVDIDAKLQRQKMSVNVVGAVPGQIKDSFIVFSAHYDHLGMMGAKTVFPGASDNASGTAMLLYLAEYYARHPQKYTMVFIAFSGEEAGLLGSRYFVQNSPIPLSNIKFLTNIDIMGDATDGVTVVNATERPAEFALLNSINDREKYLPVIKSRGKAANSDHYFFSEAGVPAFFLYSNGGNGYYHDVYDRPEEVTLNNVPGVARLLIDFVGQLQGSAKP